MEITLQCISVERQYQRLIGFCYLQGRNTSVLEEYCLIIRSNPESPWQDAEGQSYHYGQSVPRSKQIHEGVRFIMDRRDSAGVVLVGHGILGIPEDEGLDEKGRKLYRVGFKSFTSFPEPAILPSTLKNKITEQKGYNRQYSIRQITPQLFEQLVAFGAGEAPPCAVQDTFISELESLRLGKVFGEQKFYKPLMLLGAVRCLVQGDPLSFDGPLRQYYRDFAEATELDGSHPEFPYYYLQSEGFWKVIDRDGKPLEKMDTPKPQRLRGSTVEFEEQRAACIRNRLQRPAVIAALLSYFNESQQAALVQVWPDLKVGITIEENDRTKNRLDVWIRSIYDYITNRGFYFTPAQIAAFYCALRTKPFVILAGISGTGKTRLPRLFAEAIGAQIRIEAVRPDWTDSADLIGYRDLNERFRPGRLLVFADQAAKNPERPYFFVLDEMNLARVEHYFADVLSKIESRRRQDRRIVTDPLLAPEEIGRNLADKQTQPEQNLGATAEEPIQYSQVSLPDNLFIIGTVNMDETTHAFSRKVLDRAFTLEFSEVNLAYRKPQSQTKHSSEMDNLGMQFLQPIGLTLAELDDQGLGNAYEFVIENLIRVNESLQKAQLQVGYRVRDEACLYVCHANQMSELLPPNTALDYLLCAKILPRIQGGAFVLKDILLDLVELSLTDNNGKTDALRSLIRDVRQGDKTIRDLVTSHPQSGAIKYPMTLAKTLIMLDRLDRDGYTSYWL